MSSPHPTVWPCPSLKPLAEPLHSVRACAGMEQVANMLSPHAKPMVVIRSPSSIEAYPPGGQPNREWIHHSIVGRGKFTVDEDRLKLAPHLQHLISARKAQALAENDLVFFRVLHARAAILLEGTGIAVPEEPYSAWMATMRFESVHDGKKSKSGLTPLYYAVLAARKDLVAALLERGADLRARGKANIPKFVIMKGGTIIGSATALTDDPELIQLLIQHGADPREHTDPINRCHSLHWAVAGSNCKVIKYLLEHDPELINIRNPDGQLPLELAAGFGKLEPIRFMQEHYPEVGAPHQPRVSHDEPDCQMPYGSTAHMCPCPCVRARTGAHATRA